MKHFVIAAAILGTVLVSGFVDINIDHKIHAPEEITRLLTVNSNTFYDIHIPFKHTQYDLRLNNEIKDTNTVKEIIKVLQDASKGDRVIFHLAGYGGIVDSVIDIISNIKTTKAYVIMSVEAPVYSGHAYLALAGNELKMSPYTFLMFHSSSALSDNCDDVTGLDRGRDKHEKCLQALTANLTVAAQVLLDFPVLTPEQKTKILSGFDVYIFSYDVQNLAK